MSESSLVRRWYAIEPERVARAGVAAALVVAIGAGLAESCLGVDAQQLLTLLPDCWFRAWTGIPCPGCGMTRAWLLLAQLRPGEAVAANPAAPALAAAAVVAVVRPQWLRRFDRVTPWLLAAALSAWGVRLAALPAV